MYNKKLPIPEQYQEVRPTTPWNYGLLQVLDNKLEESLKVVSKNVISAYPWSAENAPIEIKVKAKRIPSWQLYNDMAGPLPYSLTSDLETGKEEETTLNPYGYTTLRIAQFPVIRR